jgi:RNA polymerase-binding transcription factor
MLRDGEWGPRWRAILEDRWRDRVQEITELSLAYHSTVAGAPDGSDDKRARRLLRRTVAARRRLADTEDALTRLAAGDFGRCEQCAAPIPVVVLAAAPETRYCPGCAAGSFGPTAGHWAGHPPVPPAERVPTHHRAVTGRGA